ncbi:hypothetical protein SAMN04515672_3694 [Natronorubrum texcoconense]|uniref:PIN domain-containing protein n=1 Tax=Natronorubrum texcoconense TaxID=1095776 RepID=A0A1G9DZL1_9EURY|nr:hypothetical protein SAMN04515672_3694 [Natronorubrum texcoconense]
MLSAAGLKSAQLSPLAETVRPTVSRTEASSVFFDGDPFGSPDYRWSPTVTERDTDRVVTNAATLVEVRGDVDTVVAAATYVEDHGFTPFDALHLVEFDGDTIVSTDDTYDGVTSRLDLETVDEQ